MKILHFIYAAFAAVGIAVTMTSCDEHIEFPDTAMKTCDILCTDGEIVRFSDIESKGKTPIGVVFHVNQDGKTEGTGYAVYLWDVPMAAFSDSLGVKQNTSANPALSATVLESSRIPLPIQQPLTAMAIPTPCMPLVFHQLPLPSLTCGSMARVPISPQSPSSSCCMPHGMPSTATSANVVVT